MPDVVDRDCSAPANEDPCQQGDPKAYIRYHLKSKHSQRLGNHGMLHVNINIDTNTHCEAFEDVSFPGEFKNPDPSINVITLGKYDENYIRPNADLESRPPIRSREQLKCII